MISLTSCNLQLLQDGFNECSRSWGLALQNGFSEEIVDYFASKCILQYIYIYISIIIVKLLSNL